MQMEQLPAGHIEISEAKRHNKTEGHLTTAPSTNSLVDQIFLTQPPVMNPTTTRDDSDHMIAILLKDLSDHLKEQRIYHEKQARTNDVIDRAVIELSKLTWILKLPQNNSSVIPAYKVHMATNTPYAHSIDRNDSQDEETTLKYHTESHGGQNNKMEDSNNSQRTALDRILSTRVPNTEYHYSAQTVDMDEKIKVQSTNQQQNQTVEATMKSTGTNYYHPTKTKDRNSSWSKTIPGPWDWLKIFENSSSLHSDISLRLLIDLLSELSLEKHGMAKDLAVFNEKGQKLIKDRNQLKSSTEGINLRVDTMEARTENVTPVSYEPNSVEDTDDNDDDSDESTGSEEDKTQNKDHHKKEEIIKLERVTDHLNSIFRDTYILQDSDSAGNHNDSNFTEDSSIEDSNDNSNESEENLEEEDDPDITDNTQETKLDGSIAVNPNSNEEPVVQNPLDESNIRTEQNQINEENKANNSDNAIKAQDNDQRAEMNYNDRRIYNMIKHTLTEDKFGHDQYEQGKNEENESSDNDSDEYDYINTQAIRPEMQVFGPFILNDHSGKPYQNDASTLSNYGKHIITKRNVLANENPDYRKFRIIRSSKRSQGRRKRQADVFWQQFLGHGLNPFKQQSNPFGQPPSQSEQQPNLFEQQGFPVNHGLQSQDHSKVFGQEGTQHYGSISNPGHLQVHGRIQDPPNQGGLHSQRQLHQNQGHQQTQNGFHQTPQRQAQEQTLNGFHQIPNQQNHINPSQREDLFQYPIPPFRGYPQYSRYNSYLGFNYPHFGYPGYSDMNHEPGEYPSIETGPSADIMEEVLNNLFQRYWENVRNMLAKNGPTTTPENEYEGPVTTTKATTTTTPTTTAEPTTYSKTTTTTTKTTIVQKSLDNLLTSTTSSPLGITEGTVNTTDFVNNTKNQTSDSMAGKVSLVLAKPPKSILQNLHKRITNKNTSLPANFFRRNPFARTTQFPFF